jgi:hypothetical protein
MGGPFARFVAQCLCIARAPVTSEDPDRTGLAVQLINDFGREARLSKLEDDWRRILGPVKKVDWAISEIGQLVKRGEATVWRVATGTEPSIPDAPAIIEFEETGNLCFYVSQWLWRTIRVKPAPRARIMRIAERLHAATARERRPQQGGHKPAMIPVYVKIVTPQKKIP